MPIVTVPLSGAPDDALGARLGPMHEESYVHVHDVRAEAYGYGGRTQASRYHRAAG